MGKCEFGNFHMHAMFWDPQKSWSAHFQGSYAILSCLSTCVVLLLEVHRFSNLCGLMQVRSATLDTWLPEQVAVIQCIFLRFGSDLTGIKSLLSLRYKMLFH